MTDLEIILLGIIWVAYGVFAVHQTDDISWENDGAVSFFIVCIAPVMLVGRMIWGAIKEYE